MKLEEQVKKARSLMETSIPVTKAIYKAVDSYHRRQRWVGRNLIKILKEHYGVAKTE